MEKVAWDTETTGTDPGSRMLSLAGILFDDETGEVLERREWTVNPGMPIPPDAAKVNGFTDEAVKDSDNAGVVLREFFAWLPVRASLVAHYAQYDTGIITWEAARHGVAIPDDLAVTCTCAIAKQIGVTKRNSLDALVAHYGIQRCGEAHRAMSDADACMQYFMLVKRAGLIESPVPWDAAGHDYRYTDQFPEPLTNLSELVGAAAPLTFQYEDNAGAKTERAVTPYGWYLKDDALYFSGYCHLREERRTFRADRVQAIIEGVAS